MKRESIGWFVAALVIAVLGNVGSAVYLHDLKDTQYVSADNSGLQSSNHAAGEDALAERSTVDISSEAAIDPTSQTPLAPPSLVAQANTLNQSGSVEIITPQVESRVSQYPPLTAKPKEPPKSNGNILVILIETHAIGIDRSTLDGQLDQIESAYAGQLLGGHVHVLNKTNGLKPRSQALTQETPFEDQKAGEAFEAVLDIRRLPPSPDTKKLRICLIWATKFQPQLNTYLTNIKIPDSPSYHLFWYGTKTDDGTMTKLFGPGNAIYLPGGASQLADFMKREIKSE